MHTSRRNYPKLQHCLVEQLFENVQMLLHKIDVHQDQNSVNRQGDCVRRDYLAERLFENALLRDDRIWEHENHEDKINLVDILYYLNLNQVIQMHITVQYNLQ